ncbi:MAG: PH domain-containing protein, partial [Rhizobium oryzihabitans]
MQNAASMHDAAALTHVQASEQRQWMTLALAAIVLVTLLRILGLAFNRTDLFVDEAQYWLWGREMAFGAYSKPPLIGWLDQKRTSLRVTGSAAHLERGLFGGKARVVELAGIAEVKVEKSLTQKMWGIGTLLLEI